MAKSKEAALMFSAVAAFGVAVDNVAEKVINAEAFNETMVEKLLVEMVGDGDISETDAQKIADYLTGRSLNFESASDTAFDSQDVTAIEANVVYYAESLPADATEKFLDRVRDLEV